MAARHFPSHRADIEDGVEIVGQVLGVLGFGGAGLAIAGRVQAGGVYTPDWMPGPNKEDLEALENSVVRPSSSKKIVQDPDDAL
jgi:phosphoglycerate dehydrogenase-like enzyme